MPARQHVMSLACPDRPGIVAAVYAALLGCDANIFEAHQHNDAENGRFFARIGFTTGANDCASRLAEAVSKVANHFKMTWNLRDLARKQRVLILVSRFDHCLADLLYRWRTGELSMEIVGIVSNYPIETYLHHDFRNIPFFYLPVDKENRAQQEAKILKIVREGNVGLVVLARYMQILSNDMAARLTGFCINIHHSFLPGFKGAKPYHQAFARGVKLIGATAHYVTEDLDEGPIIEQDVERVSHHDTPEALICKGRDIERRVLSRAVAWHLEGRVLLNGGKTVVFKG